VRFRFTGVVYDAEVVGIVGEVRHDALDRPARAELFLPYPQSGFGSMTFVVRTHPGSPTTLQALKEQVWALDPLQAFYRTATLDELVARTLVGRRFSLVLLGGFAVAALLLAAAGLYGVMSFSTSQRTREFGVRMALGAGRRDIVRLVIGEGLTLAGLGLIVGIGAALPLTRLLRALLFGVTATDPATFVGVGATILGVAAAACYLPARRALKVDPVQALRFD
jgi:putative ABC transport system permease protein